MKKIKLPKSAEDITSEDVISDAEQKSSQLLESVNNTQKELSELYTQLTVSDEPESFEGTVKEKLRSYRRASLNILEAYRKMIAAGDELNARWNDLMKGKKRKLIPAAPSNAVIDMAESKANHFSQGLNIYKLLIVCFIGSFVGVLVEVLWCLLTNGYIESRSGLVLGPFNLLYGVGAVVLTVTLYRFRNNGKWLSFFGGMLVGSVVEYACSWVQELMFGSRSWDYSHMPFNLNGRICLMYSVFWGVLGVFWVKTVYPWIAKFVLKIPNKAGKVITWAMLVFFAFNTVLTCLAVARWSQRIELIEASNGLWRLMDTLFPNEVMEKIFANMKFG